jgi:hypothetical protein
MQKPVDIIDRKIEDQAYQFSWANEEDWSDNSVAILFTDDQGDEAQMVLEQDELLQLITDAASFLRANRK